MKYKFTVFTPTYNRAYTLQRVFDSLINQTLKHSDFEWILINDGSTDNTDELVDSFLKKANFDIQYIKQKNRGKNYSHNKAIKLAQGELFLILDSDDEIVNHTMKTFWSTWNSISSDIKKNIYGISCLCKNGYTGRLIGNKLQEGLIENTFFWKHKNKIYFETWGAINTNIFKKYLFPEINNIKFIPEAYLWDMVAKDHQIYSTNKILRIIYHQDDGFSKNIIKSYITDSKGRYIYHNMVINKLFWDLLKVNPIRILKDFIQFTRMGLHSSYSIKKMLSDIDTFYKKIILISLFIISFYFYKKDIK